MSSQSAAPGWSYEVIRQRLTSERLGSYMVAADGDLELAFSL